MKLLTVELRRFAARRANLVFMFVGLLFLAGSLALLALNSHKPSEAELEAAAQDAESEREQAEEDLADCERYWSEHPDADPDNPDPDDFPNGQVEEYAYYSDCSDYADSDAIHESDFLYGVISFAEEAPEQISFLGIVFVVCALLMAGSFVGAEWSSGGMTNLLLWKPRRLPVLGAKLVAALVSILGLTLAAGVLHIGGLYLISLTSGQVGDLDAAWWQDNGTFALRMLGLVAAATVWGISLSMIGRRTVVAIGSVIAYLVVFEFGLRSLLMSVNAFHIEKLLLSSYLDAWITGRFTLWTGYGDYRSDAVHHSDVILMWEGGGVLLAITAVLLAGSAALFSRRDTT